MAEIFIERQDDGEWHAIRNKQIIARGKTQEETKEAAKRKFPEDTILDERVRHVGHGPDKWRSAH